MGGPSQVLHGGLRSILINLLSSPAQGKKKQGGKNLALTRPLWMEPEFPEEPFLRVLGKRGESPGLRECCVPLDNHPALQLF